jgi:hypothetical protein
MSQGLIRHFRHEVEARIDAFDAKHEQKIAKAH